MKDEIEEEKELKIKRYLRFYGPATSIQISSKLMIAPSQVEEICEQSDEIKKKGMQWYFQDSTVKEEKKPSEEPKGLIEKLKEMGGIVD